MLEAVKKTLNDRGVEYAILSHPTPIRSAEDAAEFFDIERAAPVLILSTDRGLVALIKSASRRRINFSAIRELLGCAHVEMADPQEVRRTVGCEVGAVPLVGLSLPVVFDDSLLRWDCIYGGTGNLYHTLKISPKDVKAVNSVVATI